MAMEEDSFSNHMGDFSEKYWPNIVFPAQIAGTCCAHAINDTLEYRYRLAYQRAGYHSPPFTRFCVQYMLDKVSIENDPDDSAKPKDKLFRICYPFNWRGRAGGGLVDAGSYCGPGMRGENHWREEYLRCDPKFPIDRFPLTYVKMVDVFHDADAIKTIEESLRDGPVYGDFFIYDDYGSPGQDQCKHSLGEPHIGVKPTKEMEIEWEENPELIPAGHSVVIMGSGIHKRRHESRKYFLYRNSWGASAPGKNGFMRVCADYLAMAFIPEIPHIPPPLIPLIDTSKIPQLPPQSMEIG